MKKFALLFPGQGSQYVGMGKGLCEKSGEARRVFEEASDVLKFDLQKLCFEGSLEELTRTENTQPAILTCSVAAFKVYIQEGGVEPVYCAGHSLGEFSALTCAGVLEFSDAVHIVRQRGKFMQEAAAAGTGAMFAVSGMGRELLEEECRNHSAAGGMVVISNYNSPEQIVISGDKGAVESLGKKLGKMGARIVPLKVSAPFHSPLMQPAGDKLKEELIQYTCGDFKYPVLSNITASPYPGRNSVAELLTRQMTGAVQWEASMKYLEQKGVQGVVEIGPQTVLRNLAKKNSPGIKAYAYDNEEDRQALRAYLAPGSPIQKEKVGFANTVITKCMAAAVCTRNRNWDNDAYRKGVVEPYKKIQKLQEELRNEGMSPSREQMAQALEMLRSVFSTKKVPAEEQCEILNEILDTTGTRHLFPDFKMPCG